MSIGRPSIAFLAAVLAVSAPPAGARTLSAPGAAHVTVRAAARWCDGAPRMRLRVDGATVGTRVVRSPFAVTFRFAKVIPAGVHRVGVTLANRHRGRDCRRGLRLGAVRLVPIGARVSSPLLVAQPGGAPAAAQKAPATAPATAAPSAAPAPAPAPAPDTNPLAGRTLYVAPAPAVVPAAIASRPQATWFGDFSGDVRAAVDATVTAADAAGAVPTLVAYDIPQRDCGGQSAGGAPSPDAYRTWIRAFADGIAGRPAIVIVEPDALPSVDCLAPADRATRFDLVADAVDVLAAQPRAVTYIDIGHSAWLPADQAAGRLQRANVAHARGFALNVSNFNWSADEDAYGRDVAARLDGDKGFVVDTSRNGRGPAPGGEWCNPADRGLGAPPQIAPGDGPDADLWIKRPGESDGACNGGPPAGVWWPQYALGLVQRALAT